jgi:putative DNA primase/helicase
MVNGYQLRPSEPLSVKEKQLRLAALERSQQPFEKVHGDVRMFGEHAASVLMGCARAVSIAASGEKIQAFRQSAVVLAKAVSEQWIPKSIFADRLEDIARANNNLGLNQDEVQNIIAAAIGSTNSRQIEILPCDELSESSSKSGRRVSKRRLICHRASEIEPERLVWIWAGRIACGKVMLIGGPPGLGKSQVTVNIAATVSIGGHWPGNEGSAPEGDVIILSAEDGIADTIVPRLIAAGANLNRIHIVAAATKPDGTGRKTFSLKTDVDLLERMVAQIGTVRVIIIDPISAYMGGADGNGNVETREVLEPLAEMANRLGIAVVAVTHLNKGGAGGQTALNRFAGSIAFVAAARSAYLIIEDPEDEHRRLFLEAKNNLGPKSRGLAFRVEQRLVGDDILASNISWETDSVMASVDEALSASENRGANEGRTGKDDAADFLRAVLAAGPMPVLEIEQEARAAGLLGADSSISQNKAFRSARTLLGIKPQRTGGAGATGKWVWELPPPPKMPSGGLDALHFQGHLSGSRAS